MLFFTTTRRGQVALTAGLLAGISSLLGFFDLWAFALVGTAGGLIVLNLIVADNVYRGRLAAKTTATRERQSGKGLNSSVARIEASLAELTTLVSTSSGRPPTSVGTAHTANSVATESASAVVESIGRLHDYQLWWSTHAPLLGVSPQTATALALPPALSRLGGGQTVLFIGTAATASWAYETLLSQQPTVRVYLGFLTANELEQFDAFAASKTQRLDHLSFVLDPDPRPAASMGGIPATAVDLMLLDFGASDSHQTLTAAIPENYLRWLREDVLLVALDSRQGIATGATRSILDRCQHFVVAIDSYDTHIRTLKRAAR